MKKYWLIPVVFVAMLVPAVMMAAGTDSKGGFDSVVRFVESKYHVKPAHTPIPWWVRVVSPGTAHKVESTSPTADFNKFAGPVDTEELYRVVKEKLGPDWQQVIRETGRKPDATAAIPHGWDRKGNEQTLMFVRPQGEQMGMFLLDYDGDEMFVMQISVDPSDASDAVSAYKQVGDKSKFD